MDLEITPEPTDAERQAIVEALRLEEAGEAPPTPWHRAGLEPDAPAPLVQRGTAGSAPEPRQSRGATRA